jgi:hypothetical protein
LEIYKCSFNGWWNRELVPSLVPEPVKCVLCHSTLPESLLRLSH